MSEKYKSIFVWMSSSTRYVTFAIVGACEKVSMQLRSVDLVGSLSDGV